MALTIDGSGTAGNSSTVSISTTKTDDVVVLFAFGDGGSTDPVTAVSDTAGLTWHHAVGPVSLSGGTVQTFDLWWAYSSGILSSDTITATGNANNGRLVVAAVNGANTTTPFDTNASNLNTVSVALGTDATINSTTDAANTLLLFGIRSGNIVSGPSGFTSVLATGSFTAMYTKTLSATQSGVAETYSISPASQALGCLVAIQAASVGPTLGLTDIAASRIIQRVGTSASVTVAGTYTGTAPTTIEASVTDTNGTVVAYTALTSPTIGGGTFTGTISVPQGGGRDSTTGYLLHVRSKDGGGAVMVTTDGANRWGVGKIIPLFGSSTPSHWFSDATTDTCSVRLSKYNGSWGTCTGAGAISFGNQAISDDPGIPIGLMDYGVSGTVLNTQWASNVYSGYTALTAAITAVGGKIEYGIVHVGSNDARTGVIVSQADHETKYRSLCSNLRSDIGQPTVKIFIMGCQRSPAETTADDTYWNQARAGEMNVGDDTGNAIGSTVIDLPIDGDNIHLTPGATGGNAVSAKRVAKAVKSLILGSGTYRGPQPTSFKYYSATGWAVITCALHGGTSLVGRTSQSNITGIVYKAAGTPLVPVTAPFISGPNTITANLATGLSTVTAEIEPGVAPDITNSVFDNQ